MPTHDFERHAARKSPTEDRQAASTTPTLPELSEQDKLRIQRDCMEAAVRNHGGRGLSRGIAPHVLTNG